MQIDSKLFIREPYRKCPSCQKTSYGYLVGFGESSSYCIKCWSCGYSENHPLPKVKKSIFYLDQFVISRLVKLESNEYFQDSDFWKQFQFRLNHAIALQAVICPHSEYHIGESSSMPTENYKKHRDMYKKLSQNTPFLPYTDIESQQIQYVFESWIKGTKVNYNFDSSQITLAYTNPHKWNRSLFLQCDVDLDPQNLINLKNNNSYTKQAIKTFWEEWKQKDFSLKKELSRDLNDKVMEFCKQKPNPLEKYEKYFSSKDMWTDTVIRFLQDQEAILQIPSWKISSVMMVNLIRSATLGSKKIPKSFVDNLFISAYLPYCNAMFIDNESRILLQEVPKDTPKSLRITYNTQLFSPSNKYKALEYLDSLIQKVPKTRINLINKLEGKEFLAQYKNTVTPLIPSS